MVKLTQNAWEILRARYLRKDESGKLVETPEEMFRRVAHNVALAEAKYLYPKQINEFLKRTGLEYWQLASMKRFKRFIKKHKVIKETEDKFYQLMTSLDFLPNSPTLFNAGRKLQQLAACFVLPIEDSMDSIFMALYKTAILHQSGGGTGFSFSHLRPRGDLVAGTGGKASGPVSFMKIFDAATEQIRQGGKRRGANMGILSVYHPDIFEFMAAKSQPVLKNFNLSVSVDDNFMQAVQKDKKIALVNPKNNKTVQRVKARKVFSLMCRQAWQNADPGMIFIDTINKHNPLPSLGKIESTNPCGEQPLLPYEACNLGSINLAQMVKGKLIDWIKLRETVGLAVRFLDDVIDMSNYVFPEIKEITLRNRKIGLGVMGFAEMLVQMEISYNNRKAIEVAEEVMSFIEKEAKRASVDLALRRGVFPNAALNKSKQRHATLTTIAPTGSISLIADCSSGIEPLFALAFSHEVLEGKQLFTFNKYLTKKIKDRKILEQIKKQGTLKNISLPKEIKELFVTALEVPAEQHLKIQAAFQKYTDNAVSKTINLPKTATPKEIEKIFMEAWQLGCKGVTVYRYGSKEEQVLTMGEKVCQECD